MTNVIFMLISMCSKMWLDEYALWYKPENNRFYRERLGLGTLNKKLVEVSDT